MSKVRINVANRVLCCAFCIHWYDPLFSHINPTGDPWMKFWEYDKEARAICEIKHKESPAFSVCHHFEKRSLK